MLNIPQNLDPTVGLVVILVSLVSLAIAILNKRRLPRWLHIGVATTSTIALCTAVVIFAIRMIGSEATAFVILEELRVQAGDTLTIGPDSLNLRVNEWVMEDRSTISIPSDVCGEDDCTWVVEATMATFGSDVRIVGVGVDGMDGGRPGDAGADAGGRGNRGGNGREGNAGLPGGNGVNVDITMGLVSIGNLLIDVSGGEGGQGANGGSGGAGSRGGCSCICDGGRGGNGGRGGAAGSGGDAGNIRVSYWIAASEPIVTGPSQGFQTNVHGGRPGTPGNGGRRGSGGGGSGECGPWPHWRHGGGSRGNKGSFGAKSSSGEDGTAMIVVEPRPLI